MRGQGTTLMRGMPPFFAKQKKITVNQKINKKHEIVKRSHHSTYSGSRENHRTLISGEKIAAP